MGDGRDGLTEAVHLAAEKRALAREVLFLREENQWLRDRLEELEDEDAATEGR